MTKFQKLINWFRNNRENVIRASYVIPILIAAGISVYHVVTWYGMANPLSWAVYLSIGVEIAALSALAGMTSRMNKFVYVPFVLVTMIQIIGNIFASFEYINVDNETFKEWVLLVEPIFDSMGIVDEGDMLGHRRFLGILTGIFIPIISLSFLHLLVKRTTKIEVEEGNETQEAPQVEETTPEVKEEVSEPEEVAEPEVIEPEEVYVEEVPQESFEEFVNQKKRKLEEDKKIFMPLLDLLYKEGGINQGDAMPTYVEFKNLVDQEEYSDDNLKMFLTLCNYLEITDLSNNIRTAKVSFDDAKAIMNKYLSLDDNKNDNKSDDGEIDRKDWYGK